MPTVSCPRRTFARGIIIRRCRRNAFRPSGLATTPTIDNGTQPRYSRALTFACTRGHGSGSIARRDKKLWELPGSIFLFRILFLWEERDWECFSRNLVMDLIRLGCVVYTEEVNATCYIFRGIFIYSSSCNLVYRNSWKFHWVRRKSFTREESFTNLKESTYDLNYSGLIREFYISRFEELVSNETRLFSCLNLRKKLLR